MSVGTLEVFCDDERYPAMTDAQLSECIATIRAFSQGHPVRLESESWFGNFRRLLPMCWKYKQDAEYWKSWQDPDKIKKLEAENADLLAIAQGQREREKLIVEAAISAIRQERRWRLEDSECGGCEINESCDRAERQFRDLVTGIGTKK